MRLDCLVGSRPGDDLRTNSRAFHVAGILPEHGSHDDGIPFTRPHAAWLVTNQLQRGSLVAMTALCTDCPVAQLVTQIARVLPERG